jgi:hypothetical protein
MPQYTINNHQDDAVAVANLRSMGHVQEGQVMSTDQYVVRAIPTSLLPPPL